MKFIFIYIKFTKKKKKKELETSRYKKYIWKINHVK